MHRMLVCLSCLVACAGGPRPIASTNVAIIDVERGVTTAPRTILIRDGRIVAIGATVRIPDNADRIDGRGRFALPGLTDMHVHLFGRAGPNTWAFPLFVANGVTAVREMATRPASLAIVQSWRTAIARGTVLAPRIVAAGTPVFARTPDDATAQVAATAHVDAAARADFIKVFSDLPIASWRAVLAAARHHRLPVVGHVPAGVTLLDAARAGQLCVEHLMQAFEACTASEPRWLAARANLADATAQRDADEPAVLAAFDPAACTRVALQIAALHQVHDPTLVLAAVEAQPASPLAHDPRWRTLPASEHARWTRLLASQTAAERATAAQRWTVARQIVATFARAGVPIVAGTDAPMPRVYPGFALHDELEALVHAGLSPADALRAATSTPARVLHLADAGTVAIGNRADLVILDADPLRDIRNTRRIHAVILAGRPFDRAALDAALAADVPTAIVPTALPSKPLQLSPSSNQ